jgi:3D (Asp-Asp-Asp) domain-containing protein
VTAPAQVPAAEAPPVPPGTVELPRLGFSFVTGGPGACGVVLEPWTHVAVSRELLAAYGCGARVRVTLDDAAGGVDAFEGVVGDTMNPQFSRTVNVYVAEDEPALEYGVTTGSITPLD